MYPKKLNSTWGALYGIIHIYWKQGGLAKSNSNLNLIISTRGGYIAKRWGDGTKLFPSPQILFKGDKNKKSGSLETKRAYEERGEKMLPGVKDIFSSHFSLS